MSAHVRCWLYVLALSMVLSLSTPLNGARLQHSGLSMERLEGDYWNGPGISGLISLRITADGNFRFERASDVGILEKGSGAIALKDGWLDFDWQTFESDSGRRTRMTRERWRPVVWGGRVYVVPAGQLMEFVNWVNLGYEPRSDESGLFVFRKGDSQRRTAGLPILPARYMPFLLAEPVWGHVVRIGRGDAEIDIGRNRGLRPGMLLLAETAGGWFELEVVKVRDRTSIARVRFKGNGRLFVGQKVLSRQPER